ncbi:hypothetical protein Tco_0209226 [Tanacetum coccineum]
MLFLCLSHQTIITMAQDNGYAFVEVQEDDTKTICIDCLFEAQPGHGMSFDTRPKPREAITTATGLAGGSVATRTITVAEVIDDWVGSVCWLLLGGGVVGWGEICVLYGGGWGIGMPDHIGGTGLGKDELGGALGERCSG